MNKNNSEKSYQELKVPSLRAHMGDWIYYIGSLRLKDIAERVSLAQQLHTSRALKDLIQREVDESVHSESIKTYLLKQNQRLFNALVIAIYGGAPRWAELSIDDTTNLGFGKIPKYMKGTLGILELQGTEKLFAIDGQHRVVGIKRAILEQEEIGEEEVSVIFVGHSNDRKGLQRTRRLFTTLNRYAKPVSKTEQIALDEDDAVAIITRRLLENYRLLKDFTSILKSKSIPNSDRTNLTTVVALYDSLDKYFGFGRSDWRTYKRQRPTERELKEMYKTAVELWDLLQPAIPPLMELRRSKRKDEIAFKYRNREVGGHLIFRPVGLLMIILNVRRLVSQGLSLQGAIKRIAAGPMELASPPWAGLLWDVGNKRMMVSGENQRVAMSILFYGSGGDLDLIRTNPEKLRNEWAGILDQPREQLHLPLWTN